MGIGRVQETMEGVNDAFKKAHIPLPLPTATTVTDKNRREAGEQMVMKLNGDRMKQILSQVATLESTTFMTSVSAIFIHAPD